MSAMRERVQPILAIVRRDFGQIHRHGLATLLVLTVLLFFLGILGFSIAGGTLREIGVPPWTGGLSGESLPINLLDFVYGYMVLVTMILLPFAFSSNYGGEMEKGAVRTLTLYPVGVLEVTFAKLLYAAIAGFLFSFPISVLPAMTLGKPAADVLGIYATAYLFSFGIVAVAAFTANLLTYFTKRMYLKPTLMSWLFVLYSFFLTFRIFGFLMGALAGPSAAGIRESFAPLIALSPYHQGGLLLSGALGGPGSPDWVVFLIPVLLLVAGVWFSRKLYPDIYEKE